MPSAVIIDDDPVSVARVRELLTAIGYTVGYARTGEKGFEFAVDLHPDVVLVALGLDDISDTVVRLRTDHRTRPSRLLAMSSYRRDMDQLARLAGFELCIAKPVEAAPLYAALESTPRAMSLP